MLDHHRRIYARAQWTVEKKVRGWYIRRATYDDESKGPYRSGINACLTIARNSKRNSSSAMDVPHRQLEPCCSRGCRVLGRKRR
jgi:hypothetical protein